MNRNLFVRGLFFAVALIVVAASRPVGAQVAELKPEEMRLLRAHVEKAGPVSLWVVTMEFSGSFESVREQGEKVKKEFLSQKLGAAMGSFKPEGILVLHEDPTGKSQFKMSVGYTVPSRVEVQPPLRVEEIRYPKAVRHTHVGRYEELEKVYRGIEDVKKSASWPVVLRLIDDPERIPAEWTRTELITPLK